VDQSGGSRGEGGEGFANLYSGTPTSRSTLSRRSDHHTTSSSRRT
jgi:hypothetical protein